MHRFTLRTGQREELVDITAEVATAVAELGLDEGAVLLHVPHTTAAVTINEGYDPDVASDVVADLNRRVPRDAGYAHAEGNSDSHIKAILVGSSQPVPVEAGKPALGRWQRIFFCEFDGPRSREVWVAPISG
ncbi:MAG TPA: secondary thiamine-phosphate synthase enzyme YjbQ [Gaiellales bacterium]|nr:secondary thiamine-phosphate synthase enzyme YjbQ [Gaiellales bacterium]